MLQSQHHIQAPHKWPQADGAASPDPACAGGGQHTGRCAPCPAGWGPSYAPQEHGMELGGGCGRGGNPLKAAGSGRRIPTRQLSCRSRPTAPGLRLLPDLESSRWESHPGSHGRGWQHAAQGDHRGGGHLAPCPSAPRTSSHQAPFLLEIPLAECCPQGARGHPFPPPTWVMHPRLAMRRGAGTDSGQRRSRRCLRRVGRLA